MFIRSAAMAAVGARRRGGRAVTGVTRRPLGRRAGGRGRGAAVFWPLAAFCPAERCGARGALARLERLKGYLGERLRQSGLMQLAWASPRQTAKQRVNNFDLATCKGTSKLAASCPGLRARPQSANKLRSRRFGSETNRAKHLHITKLGLGCPAAAFMVRLCMTADQA